MKTMKNRWIEPVTLAGSRILLEPLSLEHLDGLSAAVKDGELWNLWFTSIPSLEKAEAYIKTALDMRENTGAMPFVIRDRQANTIIGCTRYFNVDEFTRAKQVALTGVFEAADEPV